MSSDRLRKMVNEAFRRDPSSRCTAMLIQVLGSVNFDPGWSSYHARGSLKERANWKPSHGNRRAGTGHLHAISHSAGLLTAAHAACIVRRNRESWYQMNPFAKLVL